MTFFIMSLNSFSQVNSETDFNEFKSYFNNIKKGEKNDIPMDLCQRVFGKDIDLKDNEYINGVRSDTLFEKEKSTIAIVAVMGTPGGYTSSYFILSFSH